MHLLHHYHRRGTSNRPLLEVLPCNHRQDLLVHQLRHNNQVFHKALHNPARPHSSRSIRQRLCPMQQVMDATALRQRPTLHRQLPPVTPQRQLLPPRCHQLPLDTPQHRLRKRRRRLNHSRHSATLQPPSPQVPQHLAGRLKASHLLREPAALSLCTDGPYELSRNRKIKLKTCPSLLPRLLP